MQTNSPYLFKVPKVNIIKGRIEFVLKKCKEKKVLHLGCVDEGMTKERIKNGMLMHLQLIRVTEQVWGVDKSKEGIKLLTQYGIKNLIYGDVERLDSIKELQGKKYDIILATEIIEHLNNPGLFLQVVKTLFSSNTEMILTTPNAFRFTEFGYNFKGYEFVHPDHNYWFSWKTLSSLLTKNGYIINEILTYSYTDHKIPILQKAIGKILCKKNILKEEIVEKKLSKKIQVNKLSNRVKNIVDILIKRYLYKRNPFFADGLIFIVKPKGYINNEQYIKK